MPPDPEAQFLRALARAVICLVVAIEESDGPRGTEALKTMLDLIIAHRDGANARRDAALVRAVARLDTP